MVRLRNWNGSRISKTYDAVANTPMFITHHLRWCQKVSNISEDLDKHDSTARHAQQRPAPVGLPFESGDGMRRPSVDSKQEVTQVQSPPLRVRRFASPRKREKPMRKALRLPKA